jgi:hypothetical protein
VIEHMRQLSGALLAVNFFCGELFLGEAFLEVKRYLISPEPLRVVERTSPSSITTGAWYGFFLVSLLVMFTSGVTLAVRHSLARTV